MEQAGLSTHDLTQRSTLISESVSPPRSFQLTTSRRGRRFLPGDICPGRDFQLTTSRRGRLPLLWGHRQWLHFQLTTSRRGRPDSVEFPSVSQSFNSRPHAEVDWRVQFDSMVADFFQLTTSRRGRQRGWCSTHPGDSFNSRPHAEVDLWCCAALLPVLRFQLTTSRRGRLSFLSFSVKCRTFQLTTSRRGRQPLYIRIDGSSFLSTHDLTQRSTVPRSSFSCKMVLSTHDLTQRSTSTASFGHAESYLSTHDLTQRSTQSTVSRLRTMPFQLTTSRRGRLQMAFAMALGKVFQLTTSRRGRPWRNLHVSGRKSFNSRPHAEVDTTT